MLECADSRYVREMLAWEKEKIVHTTPFGVNWMRSLELYWAAQ